MMRWLHRWHMIGENSKKDVCEADVVIIVGTYTFPEVFPSLESPFNKDAKIFHIDLNSYDNAKNHPVTMELWANPKLALRKINDELEKELSKKSDEFFHENFDKKFDGKSDSFEKADLPCVQNLIKDAFANRMNHNRMAQP